MVTISGFLAAATLAGCSDAAEPTPPVPDAAPDTDEPLPLPEGTRGPAIPEKGYLVEEIRDGVYWVTEGLYQAMFLVTGDGVIAVDAPPSVPVATAIAEVTSEPIRYLVYTHSHIDHIAGAGSLLADNPEIVAHADTAAQLAAAADPNRPVPTLTFEDQHTLTLGAHTLDLAYLGPHHEPGNIYVHAPDQRVLMVVDIVFPGWSPFRRLAIAEDVVAFVAAHDAILAYDFDTLVSGHVTRLGTRTDVEQQREYILDIRDNALAGYAQVDFGAVIGEVGFDNPWYTFEVFINRVVDVCESLTGAKWNDRLGGADVFTRGHCDALADSVRID